MAQTVERGRVSRTVGTTELVGLPNAEDVRTSLQTMWPQS
jgi:hypothetical protein